MADVEAAKPSGTCALRPIDEKRSRSWCAACPASFEGDHTEAREWFLTHAHDRIYDIERNLALMSPWAGAPWAQLADDLEYLLDRFQRAEGEAEAFAATVRGGDDQLTFSLRLLAVMHRMDFTDALWWRLDPEGTVRFFILCHDEFAWGTADCEEVTPANLADLEKAVDDVLAVTGDMPFDAPCLFVARVRGMRPQGAAYPADRRLWPLFDAAGPGRDIGLLNPDPPGGRHRTAPSDGRRLRCALAEVGILLDIVHAHETRGGLAGATPGLRTGLDRLGALLGAHGVSPEAAQYAAATLGAASAEEGP